MNEVIGSILPLLIRESVVLGRTGEVGGDLRMSTQVTHDGQPLVREDLDLGREQRRAFAVLGTRRCLDTLTLLGARLDDGPHILQLAGPGSVARAITDHVHESPLDRLAAGRRTSRSGPWPLTRIPPGV